MALIDLARQMGKEIQASEEYKNLYAAKEANDNDQALQDQIGKFNLKRIQLNTEMAEEKKDNSKIAALNEELKTVYAEIMQNENMVTFTNAKNAMDAMMNEVTTILMMCVNGEDPETCNPHQSGCSGSCSGCSGCN